MGVPATTMGDPIASELGDPSEPTEDPDVTSRDTAAPAKGSTHETDSLQSSTSLTTPPAVQGVGASETHDGGASSLALLTQSTDGGAASEVRDGGENRHKSMTGNHGEHSEGRDGGKQEERVRSSPWSKDLAGRAGAEPVIDIVDGIATLQIPDAIFDEAELLWKTFVVGYFIGDAPHMGSIHATVNRIWTAPKAGSKIDVQFIAKNTVLFRIENDQMRNRVIQRKYWHIADIPLVVNVWTPESAQHPPDLWGHKGQDCSSKEIKILSKRTGETIYASMPREGITVGGGKGKEVEGSRDIGVKDDKIRGGDETGIVEAVETMPKEGNAMEHLIKDLEELSPIASSHEEKTSKISETSKELSKTIDVWVNGKGVKASGDVNGEKEFTISPSRFSPLQDIDEEEETCLEGSGTEVEEVEFRGNIVDGKKEKELQVASTSRQQGSVPRQLRGRVTGSKDMSKGGYGGRHGSSKKTSGRKL
ncbi:hypothetical protein HID58_066603 [Brassica napus]|uniref:DUF4283 domain-containing protein n=1 Tax=Brassica napus TaxID=3708 RepID=A0ABQ7ZG38_BRANA|nr:hypothetical protein HID58_066603 [Brassica napus]